MSSLEIELYSTHVQADGTEAHVVPAGELDLLTTPLLERQLAELRETGCERIVLDLRELSFVDSTALHLLVRWTESSRADGFSFEVVEGAASQRRVFDLTGVTPLLSFVEGDQRPAPA